MKKAKEELSKIEQLDEQTITKIIDILPQTKQVLEMISPKNSELSADDTEKVLDVTKKYAK